MIAQLLKWIKNELLPILFLMLWNLCAYTASLYRYTKRKKYTRPRYTLDKFSPSKTIVIELDYPDDETIETEFYDTMIILSQTS